MQKTEIVTAEREERLQNREQTFMNLLILLLIKDVQFCVYFLIFFFNKFFFFSCTYLVFLSYNLHNKERGVWGRGRKLKRKKKYLFYTSICSVKIFGSTDTFLDLFYSYFSMQTHLNILNYLQIRAWLDFINKKISLITVILKEWKQWKIYIVKSGFDIFHAIYLLTSALKMYIALAGIYLYYII